MPGAPLLQIILVSQILNGVLLPFVLVFMLLLINRAVADGRASRTVASTTSWPGRRSLALVVLTVLMVVTSLLPGAS